MVFFQFAYLAFMTLIYDLFHNIRVLHQSMLHFV